MGKKKDRVTLRRECVVAAANYVSLKSQGRYGDPVAIMDAWDDYIEKFEAFENWGARCMLNLFLFIYAMLCIVLFLFTEIRRGPY